MNPTVKAPLILVESRTARQQMIQNVSVLDMLGKPFPVLTRDGRSTIKQVAEFYEVHQDVIESILRRNKEEFSVDGIAVIPAKDFNKLEFIEGHPDTLYGLKKTGICEGQDNTHKGPQTDPKDSKKLDTYLRQDDGSKSLTLSDVHSAPHKKARNTTLLPKQASLRIGMLLTKSEWATKVRDRLIAGERQLSYRQKTRAVREAEKWEAQREAAKMVRSVLTDAIDTCVADSPSKKWKYKNFTDLAYRSVFGQSAKSLRMDRGASDADSLRDGFSVAELQALERAETFIAASVMAGCSYEEVKAKIGNIDFWVRPVRKVTA